MNINLQIAKAKELNIISINDDNSITVGNIGSSYHLQRTIDYTKDPKLILELVLELIHEGWYPVYVRYSEDKMIYGWKHRQKCPLSIKDFDFGIATAMAWLEEFK